ncbi:armadillo-type protein [Emericellopsis atlantica]|uniref:Armadillo-type protein n=1 Tax=Emericellopsis atlantica TaxID=2614577 RepID=A0A9P7ZN42_9HYPO|nr:armadillo-type protein [Emericellopsis atlantica]KAG9254721.1 armadillo-type protein [Emericellopsis atlantica]
MTMMLSAAEIEDLLANNGSGLTPDEYDEQPETEDVMKNRAALLTPVLETCQQLWDAKSDDLKLVAQKLGDGSRDVAWRIAFGESGILNFFLEINAAKSLSPDLQLHTLRLVGNSCADTDQNRARVVEADLFKPIMDLLEDESLTPVVVPVLYNIVVDYEPAQLHASRANLSAALIGRLAGPSIDEFAQLVTYMCKTLVLISGQDGEATRADPSTVRVLLGLANREPFSSDIEDFAILTSAAAAYLSMEEFQVRLISDGQLPLLLSAIKHANTVFSDVQDKDGEDLTALLKAMRSTFQQTLADVTAQDTFLKQYPLNDPVSSELFSWLNGANRPLRSAACLSLGNLCRSDATSKAMVQEHKAHEPLIKLIADPDARDAQELHAALSFLKNMAIPIDNKPALVDALEPTCVPRILALDSMPQVQFAAVSLIRLLLINSPNNAEAICSRWRSDGQVDESDTVQKLAELFKRSDTEPVKMEIARGILGLCRVVQSQPVQSVLKDIAEVNNFHDDEELRELFWKRYDFTEPLAYLVAQAKWPSVRSEAWFVFALICRSQEGSRALSKALEDEKAFSSLSEAVTGEQGMVTDVSEEAPTDAGLVPGGTSLQLEPQQIDPARQSDMARVDRENAVVMCQELLKHQPEDWPRRGALQALVSQGTRKIIEGKSS